MIIRKYLSLWLSGFLRNNVLSSTYNNFKIFHCSWLNYNGSLASLHSCYITHMRNLYSWYTEMHNARKLLNMWVCTHNCQMIVYYCDGIVADFALFSIPPIQWTAICGILNQWKWYEVCRCPDASYLLTTALCSGMPESDNPNRNSDADKTTSLYWPKPHVPLPHKSLWTTWLLTGGEWRVSDDR